MNSFCCHFNFLLQENKACHCDATWLIRHRRPLVEMILLSQAKFISVLKWVHQGWQEKQTDHLTPSYWWFQSEVALWVCVSRASHRGKRGVVWQTFPLFCAHDLFTAASNGQTSQWDYQITDSVDMCSTGLNLIKTPTELQAHLLYADESRTWYDYVCSSLPNVESTFCQFDVLLKKYPMKKAWLTHFI